MTFIKAENVEIKINSGNSLFSSLSFEISNAETLAITGASGCGKSSLLNYIAGTLALPQKGFGNIWIDNILINQLPTEKRKVGILYQDDLLFPHMNVGENLLYATGNSTKNKEGKKRVEDALAAAGLDLFFKRLPETLSGGQKSRVSLLRTLLAEPKVILLDEPFSKLDKELRKNFRDYVFLEIRKLNIPCIIVTHDEEDIPANARVIKLEKKETF